MKTNRIRVSPSDGGRLLTSLSAEAGGIANYTVKLDWRRELDREVRAEGEDLFTPNIRKPVQPPTEDPITLVVHIQRPNRQTAVVVGTKTTLWRYFGTDDGRYVLGIDGEPYVEDGYFDDDPGVWIEIGSGFAADGRRWEAVGINGYLVLNNGRDLPMTYRLEHMSVKPIYELRELGIASVGSIAEHDGRLLLMDIRQIEETAHTAWMAGGTPYSRYTDEATIDRYQWRIFPSMQDEPRRYGSSIGCTVNPESNVITLDYAAKSIEPGMELLVVGAGENGSNLLVSVTWVSGKTVSVADAAITKAGDSARTAAEQARVNESNAQQVLDSAEITLAAARTTLANAQAASSAEPTSEELRRRVVDASTQVDDSLAKVNEATVDLEEAKAATIEAEAKIKTLTTTLSASDALGSIAGKYSDLQGDGSAILKALSLRHLLIVYKETGIYIGGYTGDADSPYEYEQVTIPMASAMRYRNTLICVNGAWHLYAGANEFYRFDLTNRVPVPVPELEGCGRSFFDALSQITLGPELRPQNTFTEPQMVIDVPDIHARYMLDGRAVFPEFTTTDAFGNTYGRFLIMGNPPEEATFSLRKIIEDTEELIFAADNPITKEIFICYPSETQDKGIRLHYESGTAGTTAAHYTAAAYVVRPDNVQAARENWFVMGTPDGKVLRYGLVAANTQPSGLVRASKTGSTVTSDVAFFTERMVGRTIAFANGERFAITGFTDQQTVTVLGSGNVSRQAFSIEPGIWHRRGQGYTSILKSCLEALGQPDTEKRLLGYVPMLSSRSHQSPLAIALAGAVNPSQPVDVLSTTIKQPLANNMIKTLMQSHYFGDSITVTGMNNPVEIVGRSFEVVAVRSSEVGRKAV